MKVVKNCFHLALVLSLISPQIISAAPKKERKLYVGSNSTEAILEFRGIVEYVGNTAPSATTQRKVVLSQIEHMVGPMSMTEFTAVPKGDTKISDIKIESKKGNIHTISYLYKGSAVVENGPSRTYPIIVPKNPRTIFKASFVGDTSPCTDEHYQAEGDFWYFWSPEREGCKLVEGKDYLVIQSKLTRIKNTKTSYPEYHNLLDKNGKITAHIFFGLDDPSKGRNPMRSGDVNAPNYRAFKAYLLKQGYSSKLWTNTEIKKIAKTTNGPVPYVETLSKGNIEYRFFFGSTGIDEDSMAFHWFYKDAIENASMFIYGGHSGLGGHLDLESIEANLGEKINFNTERYQIFFFDSCTSYKYYNTQYFERKVTTKDPRGTKKLDIFTNGLATYFHTMENSNIAIAEALDKAIEMSSTGKGYISYQTLAGQIDSDNLFGIIGDEDNESPKPFKLK